MKPDTVEHVLVELLLNQQPGISIKLKEQDAELAGIACTDRSLGAWLDDFELPIIVEILNSPDDYFQSRFPELKDFDTEHRTKLAGDIQEHAMSCPRCHQKVSNDKEFETLVDDFIGSNRDKLKSELVLTADDE